MFRSIFFLIFAAASVYAESLLQTFGSGENQFQIEFVRIGNPGNAADDTGFGSVSYTYNLGKYEISRDQINKANEAGELGITFSDMSSFGGNRGLLPASGISWYEAAKFVNYLNTSQGKQAAYNFDGSGNFQLWGVGQYSGNNQYRHKDAYYFLPNVDEWYKGAYYDPNKAGGAGYWDHPTGSDSEPNPVSGGTTAGTAVHLQPIEAGPADITNAGGLSPYGTMAQGGNVWEWNESAFDLINDTTMEIREKRGSDWDFYGLDTGAFIRGQGPPTNEDVWDGFRVASVPEPSSLSLLLAGGAALAAAWRRRKVD